MFLHFVHCHHHIIQRLSYLSFLKTRFTCWRERGIIDRYRLCNFTLSRYFVCLFACQVRGFTTSGAFNYQIGKGVAFACLPLELTEIGCKLELELLGNRYLATVVKEPLCEVTIKTSNTQNLFAARLN